jgi:hypothetical protein
MRGIAGTIDFGGPVEHETDARMCGVMEHRGPAEWLRREEVERLIDEHRYERAEHSLRLWTLSQLETLHREVVDAAVPVAVGSPAAA